MSTPFRNTLPNNRSRWSTELPKPSRANITPTLPRGNMEPIGPGWVNPSQAVQGHTFTAQRSVALRVTCLITAPNSAVFTFLESRNALKKLRSNEIIGQCLDTTPNVLDANLQIYRERNPTSKPAVTVSGDLGSYAGSYRRPLRQLKKRVKGSVVATPTHFYAVTGHFRSIEDRIRKPIPPQKALKSILRPLRLLGIPPSSYIVPSASAAELNASIADKHVLSCSHCEQDI